MPVAYIALSFKAGRPQVYCMNRFFHGEMQLHKNLFHIKYCRSFEALIKLLHLLELN